jgi:hypothetical protein
MKITRNQLRRIIKEEIELEEDATEILTTSVAQHIQVLLDKAWPKAEFVPDSPTVNADMPNANRFVLTYTFRPSIPNLKAITNKFNSNIAPKTGFKSTPLDNRGNKIFKMGLANENPVTWDGNNKKSAGGYVKLRIRVTLMDKFMATAKADPSIITSGDTETLSISENKMKITRRQLRQIIKEEAQARDWTSFDDAKMASLESTSDEPVYWYNPKDNFMHTIVNGDVEGDSVKVVHGTRAFLAHKRKAKKNPGAYFNFTAEEETFAEGTTSEGTPYDEMPASWQQILRNVDKG